MRFSQIGFGFGWNERRPSAFTFVNDGRQSDRGPPLAEHQPARPGSPEYYRERAREMIQQADEAPSETARAQLLILAGQWERLAETVEHPHW